MNIKKYEDFIKHRLIEVEAWARDGVVEKVIAKNLGISYSTLREYKKKYPSFAKALANNRAVTDIRVENALYKRAIGYTFEEVTKELVTAKNEYGEFVRDENGAILKKLEVTKIVKKEVQPDVGAQQFWLKNRKKNIWRDKQEIEHSGETTVNNKIDFTHLTTEQIKELLDRDS